MAAAGATIGFVLPTPTPEKEEIEDPIFLHTANPKVGLAMNKNQFKSAMFDVETGNVTVHFQDGEVLLLKGDQAKEFCQKFIVPLLSSRGQTHCASCSEGFFRGLQGERP
jgi:hypothetical protein